MGEPHARFDEGGQARVCSLLYPIVLVLVMLGAMRELVGKGMLLPSIGLALGPVAKHWVIHVIPDYPGFLLSILPPGAFFGLGIIIAARNWLDQRNKAGHAMVAPLHSESASA